MVNPFIIIYSPVDLRGPGIEPIGLAEQAKTRVVGSVDHFSLLYLTHTHNCNPFIIYLCF